MKKYNHGMVLGKFYPPHNGHLYLIEEMLKNSNRGTIFLCTQPSELIDGKLRYDWLFDIIQKKEWDVNLLWIKDELPQTPEEHGDFDDFYKIWCDVVQSRQFDIDCIFTSEKYGDEFAEKLGIEHVLVDLPRTIQPVSGTAVRNHPIENWKYIPNEVKPYFKKKIVIMGPESTGKSILTKKLSDYFSGDIVHEFGRTYTDINIATEMGVGDFETIAKFHDTVLKTTISFGEKQLIFIDTDAITTKIFGKMYLGDSFKSKKINHIIDRQEFDLVLVCDIDVPWVDDGTRDFPNEEDRKRHLDKILRELELREQPYKMICGNYDERFELAKKYVENLTKI